MLFWEARLPRDVVRVLMVLACWQVAAWAVSPAAPVRSRAQSLWYVKVTRSQFPPHEQAPTNLPIRELSRSLHAYTAHTIA